MRMRMRSVGRVGRILAGIGLILAALIVGASMLMRVDTPFRILGYPGFAMIFFLLAAIAGVALVVTIVMTDVKAQKKPDM